MEATLPSYVKDTMDVLTRVDGVIVDEETLLVTVNVESLYTSIDHTHGFNVVRLFLGASNLDSPMWELILELLEFVLTHNFLAFKDYFYLQKHGTAMGATCAPSYASFFLGQWERDIFGREGVLATNHVLCWLRYIDDILFLVDFLDISLNVDINGSIQTDVFRKPTAVNSLIHAGWELRVRIHEHVRDIGAASSAEDPTLLRTIPRHFSAKHNCNPGSFLRLAQSCYSGSVLLLATLGTAVEPYCTPACFADEECIYVNSSAACVANTTYYQSLSLSVYNVSSMIDCKGANMTVSVGKNLLETLHYNPSALTLSQYNCTGAVVNTLQEKRVYSFTVQTKDGLCGNAMTKNVTHITFANTVNIPGQISNGVITAGNLSMPFSCTYNLTMETALYTVLKPVMTTQNLNTGGIEGNAGTTLAAYLSSSFTQPLQQSDQENIAIGSTLYFGMTTQFQDPDFVLRIDQCFAAPTSDGSGPIKVQLIQGGCAVENGPYTQVVENGISKEVRFSITAFSFQGYTTVYLFCDARLCHTAGDSCSKCSSSREASLEAVRFGLGPFTYQDTIDYSASSKNGL
ncbi:pancreatic secretory granule membrane major glycoprotein GP2-like [Phyllobates terribilis]|uniref:pancreatic secretory granule membrane major glycoprotein GP2-like n=1 Tax=Phyllobates terribilis TaxID=111132 RepID=UPI003CCAAFC8